MWIQSEQKCVIFSEKFKQQCKSLQLFLVKYNLYHVRNRYDNDKMLFDSIYPVFPPQSLLTNLVILEAQRKVAHAGINTTLTEICSRYWILQTLDYYHRGEDGSMNAWLKLLKPQSYWKITNYHMRNLKQYQFKLKTL